MTGRKIALIVEYDGTCYHGSQLQANASTIQGEIEKALLKLTGKRTRIQAASRTDAGVHARGQVVCFRTDTALPLEAFIHGMNHYLPDDIAVRGAYNAADSFDARRQATSREYKYDILNSSTRSPLRERFVGRVRGELDVDAMSEACCALVGRHDFAAFATGDMAGKSTVRNVKKAEIERDGDMITFTMEANAFLPHQVRHTVGALIEVGQGRMSVEDFNHLVAAGQPGVAAPTAPSSGLCLMRVNYPGPFDGDAR